MHDADKAILYEFICSGGGNILFELISEILIRQQEIILIESRNKSLDAIRFAAGRAEGVSIVLNELENLRKVNG